MTPDPSIAPSHPVLYSDLRRAASLDGLESLHASYSGAHVFPRHAHAEYVVSIMVRGAEGLRYRGATHVAPAGSLILLNPGEWHANYALDDEGFAYRTLYAPVAL